MNFNKNSNEPLQVNDIAHDYVFIGSGIFALAAAHSAKELGCDVALIDKARGMGGRLASRRVEFKGKEYIFHHGCPHGNLKADLMSLKSGLRSNFYSQWTLSSLKESSQDTSLVLIPAEADQHVIIAKKGICFSPPLPQTLEILARSSANLPWLAESPSLEAIKTLEKVSQFYSPSIVLLIIVEHGEVAKTQLELSKLSFVRKVTPSVGVGGFAVELNESLSKTYLELDPEIREAQFRQSLERENPILSQQFTIVSSHRWRYARHEKEVFESDQQNRNIVEDFVDRDRAVYRGQKLVSPVELRNNITIAGDFLDVQSIDDLLEKAIKWADSKFKNEMRIN